MSCERIQAELVGYHFGAVDNEVRRQVEEHLLCCACCLSSFLAVKRGIETAEFAPLPSPEVRKRVRASAARMRGAARRWSWWERPLVLGFAGTVTIAATMAVALLATEPGRPPHGLSTCRRPESFSPR